MSRHFAALTYTPSVRASQRRYGGRELGEASGGNAIAELSRRECEFIAARDSFFLSTVSETGWPHVQHRGGPAGFLRVLDATTLAFADFSGNRQYVSVGNLAANNRAALILMDYPNQRRLKILGRIEVIDMAAATIEATAGPTVDAELLAKMQPLGREVERILLVRVAAFDWNCSRHITPRFTASEWQSLDYSPTETSTTKE
ncbi:MAG: pyridoxamine 5'-phosphate oxidase family protein [Betaproteobacteria bacterium]|nr:pyridoxamine 5'-phosphate oxidase family protein [Betaproteobacteria bacterium]